MRARWYIYFFVLHNNITMKKQFTYGTKVLTPTWPIISFDDYGAVCRWMSQILLFNNIYWVSASFELNLVNSQWLQMKNTKEKELQDKVKANLFEINWKYPWFIVDSSNNIFHLDLVHVKKHLKWTNLCMFDLG